MSTDLLRLFHEQIRLADRDHGADLVIERDGLVHRAYPSDPAQAGAMVESPEGLGPDPDLAIRRQVEFFSQRGQSVEWKTYAYDQPADLPERLRAYGFVPDQTEALLLGAAERLAEPVVLSDRYALRTLVGDAEWGQVGALDEALFGSGRSQWSRLLRAEETADPLHIRSVVVLEQDSGGLVGHAVLRLVEGTDVAGLWGGKVHPDHRGQGLYRAMTSLRAQWAIEAGHRICRVDALPTSRPILERLGMVQVTTTTPCVLSPSPAR
ncbi:MAG: GNAT family N-acetyltransferase [Dermatophilaceae bacterium]